LQKQYSNSGENILEQSGEISRTTIVVTKSTYRKICLLLTLKHSAVITSEFVF